MALDCKGIRMLHFADAHIGMENYGRIDPATGLHSRLQDFLDTLEATVDYAIEHDFDLIVFAGDAFKTRDPNPTQHREFARRIMRAAARGIPVVLLVGNHDVPNAAGKANSLELYGVLQAPNVHVLQRPTILRLDTRRGPVQVAALPHLPRSSLLAREEFRSLGLAELNTLMADKLCRVIDDLAARLDPEVPSVLTAHLSVAEGRVGSERTIMVGTEMVLPVSALDRPEFDYVALGHLHPHQVLGPGGKVVYAGSLDRVDFGEEGDAKGFVAVDLVRGDARWEFVANRVRPFVTLRVQAGVEDPTADILRAIESRDLDGAIVKLVVAVDPKRWPQVRQKEIVAALEERAFFALPIHREFTAPAVALRNPAITERVNPVDALEQYFRTSKKPACDLEGLLARARRLEEEIREAERASAGL